jgi:serine/threonine-protein kinase
MTPADEPPAKFTKPPARGVALRVFGAIDISGPAGIEALLSQPKRIALLVYLALARPRGFHRRDRLVSIFWPEHSQEHARAALRKSLHAIRHIGESDVLITRGDEEVAVNTSLLECDAIEFDEAIRTGRLARALELYGGDFLDGFFAEAPGFERWMEAERARYRDDAADAAWKLAERYEAGSDLTLAARWARRVVTLAPTDERALRRALQLLDRAGDRAGAIRAYEEFARRLRAEYDAAPSSETANLVRQIRGR